MNRLRSILTVLAGSVVLTAAAASAAEPLRLESGTPRYFTIGSQGELSCQGTTEDACAFYDEVDTPSGKYYLVQGSFSRKRHPRDKAVSAEYVNFYFALLCVREGDKLVPTFNFLEGRERVSDVHFHDLDGDGTLEVIVAAVFGPHGSYASVYRLDGPVPDRIFTRRANTQQTDFEVVDGTPTLTFEQRGTAARGSRREVFAWNGNAFELQK